MDFIWHKVTEEEKQEITKNAKKILDEFASKLDKIQTQESHFENGLGLREQGDAWKTDDEFRSTMFSNAPDVQNDCIVAEKGSWK